VLFFVIELMFNVLIGSPHEGLGKGLRSWTHTNSTLKEIGVACANYFHAKFLPTLVGLFSVTSDELVEFEE
jgi:hypothetical protein